MAHFSGDRSLAKRATGQFPVHPPGWSRPSALVARCPFPLFSCVPGLLVASFARCCARCCLPAACGFCSFFCRFSFFSSRCFLFRIFGLIFSRSVLLSSAGARAESRLSISFSATKARAWPRPRRRPAPAAASRRNRAGRYRESTSAMIVSMGVFI